MAALALAGLRVLEFGQIWSGPHCTRLLADLGAEVIKIESPRRPDLIRGPVHPSSPHEGTYPDDDPGERPYNRHGYFNERNRNKFGLALDVRHPQGRRVALELAAVSDVVVDNYAAGVMDRLGLGYDALRRARPDIIVVSMSGFGATGPERDYVGYGATFDYLAGFATVTGYADGVPQNLGINVGDPVAALHAAGAILAALIFRRATGRGQFIDLSQRESATRLSAPMLLEYQVEGIAPGPQGNRHRTMAPHGCYPCAGDDSWIAIAVENDRQWEALAGLSGLAQDERFADVVSRRRHAEELDGLVAAWTRKWERDELVSALRRAGVPCGPVNTARDLFEDQHLRARGFILSIAHPEAGTHEYFGVPWKPATDDMPVRPAPCFGEHNRELLGRPLGYSREGIEELEAAGVIASAPAASWDGSW